MGPMRSHVQLITYVDRLCGGGFAALHRLLGGPLRGLFGGVHVLPFFHTIDGADAGFDPIDHTRVDARLGGWADVAALGAGLGIDLMADLIVNHVSVESPQFLDYASHGEASEYAGLFLTPDTVFGGVPDVLALQAVYRPRPGPPISQVALANGRSVALWTTFSSQQIDIDIRHPQARAYLSRILATFAANGIRAIRLDAVGYAVKKAGTSCFMLPETFAFIDELTAEARGLGLEVLVEIHAHYARQLEIAARVDWIYDFALPPLVLHALAFGTARFLKNWLDIRPANCLTVLDTHDGIGVIDADADPADRAGRPGLLPPTEIARLVESIHDRSRGESRQATGAAASNLDLYQVNCTYFDALGQDDRAYLVARALQLFLPGIPQIYYVGLLAGTNDLALLSRTGVGRDINRHYYSDEEIDVALQKPVVRDLIDLICLRNQHPAFAGQITVALQAPDRLCLEWTAGEHFARLEADFGRRDFALSYSARGAATAFHCRSARRTGLAIDCKTG